MDLGERFIEAMEPIILNWGIDGYISDIITFIFRTAAYLMVIPFFGNLRDKITGHGTT